VIVESEGGPRAFALAIGGEDLFVTKASEVGFLEPLTVIASDRRARAERIAYDGDADLMLLRAPDLGGPRIDSHASARETSSGGDATRDLPPGSFVLSVGAAGEVISLGTVALERSQLEDADARPFLGIGWRVDRDGTASINSVLPGTPAARAGLAVGDRILRIEDRAFDSQRMLGDEIADRRAGDRLRLLIERDGAEHSVAIALDRRQPSLRVRDSGNTRSAVSRVLPHRTRVLHHDGVVDPDQCGSAVVDLDGTIVGMNAGRFDRTSTLIIPIDELERRVEAMRSRSMTEPQSWEELAESTFAVTEARGRLRLSAVDARFVGPRQLARTIGNALTPDGSGITVMADDRLRWDAIIEPPGRFEIVLAGSAPARGTLRLSIGDLDVEAIVPEGHHRKGIVLGTVDVAAGGRIAIAAEWIHPQDQMVPGSILFIDLRRVDAGDAASENDRQSARGRSPSQRGMLAPSLQ